MTDGDELRDRSACLYAAVNGVLQGDAAPMLALWSHADDATYCDTRGQIVRGWPAIQAYWRRAADLNANSPVRMRATGEIQHVVIGADLAYVVAIERVRREGDSGVMSARATNIYRRSEGDWQLLHRHADAPPRGCAADHA